MTLFRHTFFRHQVTPFVILFVERDGRHIYDEPITQSPPGY